MERLWLYVLEVTGLQEHTEDQSRLFFWNFGVGEGIVREAVSDVEGVWATVETTWFLSGGVVRVREQWGPRVDKYNSDHSRAARLGGRR